MEVSEAKRLKALEEENARLKKLLAESMMDVSTLREMLGKTSDALIGESRQERARADRGADRQHLGEDDIIRLEDDFSRRRGE